MRQLFAGNKALLLLLCFFYAVTTFAQTTINGVVKQAEDQTPLVGATVKEKGTSNTVLTKEDGSFSLNVSKVPTTLEISHVGFVTREISVSDTETVAVSLATGGELTGVTIVGTRFFNRTEITSPLPVDNISVRDLKATGQVTFDRMLNYTVPAFNSSQQTVSDATAHF
ncbi:MAG: carboxypeptidase-like regulatory domain-containing protein, partial [Bacteroidota bacterium]|nr:carboxypeptidase-like regulatory domain-containing protein [Bacteroidota bacterium]